MKIAGKNIVGPQDHTAVFTPQYLERSGPGSTTEYSAPYRAFLEQFIGEHKIKSIVDLGCGDMEIMSHVDLHGATYLGVDVIQERIERNRVKCPTMSFECRDIHTWVPTPAELILCKDVIQHWSTADIQIWLGNLSLAKFRYALITNCNYGTTVNSDIETGGWRAIDLTKPPYSRGKVVFHWDTKDVVMFDREGCYSW